MATHKSKIPEILKKSETQILGEWIKEQLTASTWRSDLMREDELRAQSAEFLAQLRAATQSGNFVDLNTDAWDDARELLSRISQTRATQGFTPSETAMFILSFKQPLFARLRDVWGQDGAGLADDLWAATIMIDRLSLITIEMVIKTREELIARQQADMLELSTPVVKLWDGILALPMIGTLDSARTQVVMESLLQRIVETGSQIAILDITGVPTVDTLVAQHLLKTVTAIRLMGADCIISGVRPQIAQTIVHLGVDLNSVTTKATLADAFAVALKRLNLGVTKVDASRSAKTGLPGATSLES